MQLQFFSLIFFFVLHFMFVVAVLCIRLVLGFELFNYLLIFLFRSMENSSIRNFWNGARKKCNLQCFFCLFNVKCIKSVFEIEKINCIFVDAHWALQIFVFISVYFWYFKNGEKHAKLAAVGSGGHISLPIVFES